MVLLLHYRLARFGGRLNSNESVFANWLIGMLILVLGWGGTELEPKFGARCPAGGDCGHGGGHGALRSLTAKASCPATSGNFGTRSSAGSITTWRLPIRRWARRLPPGMRSDSWRSRNSAKPKTTGSAPAAWNSSWRGRGGKGCTAMPTEHSSSTCGRSTSSSTR